MAKVTVSAQGRVTLPAEIRQQLGIASGSVLDVSVEGRCIRMSVPQRIKPTRPEEGYGMLVCAKPGTRRLLEFDVAEAMREEGR
jgi:AbrB family looped-hinge helix DNA binding protein